MRKIPLISIKRIGFILSTLISIIAVVMIVTNFYMEESFKTLDRVELDNYKLSNKLKEMDLPIKVVGNISQQTVEDIDKELRLREALNSNLKSIVSIKDASTLLIEETIIEIKESTVIVPTVIKPNQLYSELSHIEEHISDMIVDVLEIQARGELDNSDYIKSIEKNYQDTLYHYDLYYTSYLKYATEVRNILVVSLNIALAALIFVIMGLIALIFRLINTDMRLIEKAYAQIERHDFKIEKVLKRVYFNEEVKIQETMKKFFDNQRIIKEFQTLVSKNYVIDDIIDHLLLVSNELMGVERVAIAFYDELNNVLITEYGVSIYENIYLDVGYRSDLNNSSLNRIIKNRRGYINNNILEDYQNNPNSEAMSLIIKEGIRSNMSIPLIINNDVFGVVFFSSKNENHFSQENYDFAESLLYEITGVLNRSYLMKVFIIRMTNTIARLVDKKDIETGVHINRMVKYSTLIAYNLSKMKISTHEVDNKMVLAIERNAAIHDIGKVATPDIILKKPGKLTKEEFEIMKDHAAVGGDIFKEINKELDQFELSYYHTAEVIARYHHEKWDGSGYPEALKAYEIPLEARIVAVADVFDALSSKRVYKEAFGFEESLQYIREQSGKHFDPIVIKAFMHDLTAVKRIYDE